MMKKIWALLLALTLVAAGCAGPAAPVETSESSFSSSEAAVPPSVQAEPEEDPSHGYPTPQEYIAQVVQGNIDAFYVEGMSEYEMVKAAYDHIIQKSSHTKAVALDVWRWRSVGEYQPSYLEQRSMSILHFGRVNCYGFAAALYMLLEGMGLEARYLPGFTYTTEGAFCDHAWNQVKIDGVWYHLDPDLDGLVRRNNLLSYRYFLNSDATMAQTHFWGQRLIDTGLLEETQNSEIAAFFMGEDCPQDHPKPAAQTIVSEPTADKDTLEAQLLAELAEYTAIFGELEPMALNWKTPVFGRYEGYNSDARPEFDRQLNRGRDRETALIRPELRAPALDGLTQAEGKALGTGWEQTIPQTSRTLLVSFSVNDSVAEAAEMLAGLTDVDQAQIIPVQAYSETLEEHLSVALQELIDVTRPEIWEMGVNLSNYDTILLAYPIWHGSLPAPVSTFLESNDFSGKTIAPFCISGDLFGTSSVNLSIGDIAASAPEATIAAELFLAEGDLASSQSGMRSWISQLGL